PEPSHFIGDRKEILTQPIQAILDKKSQLIKNKERHKWNKATPPEEEDILRSARHRIAMFVADQYGQGKFSMLVLNPRFIFPGEEDLREHIANDLRRAAELSLVQLRRELPGLYWSAKIGHYNYFHGRQRATGQTGDRNHAVYIPYANYFGTSDRLLVKALKSEYAATFAEKDLHLF